MSASITSLLQVARQAALDAGRAIARHTPGVTTVERKSDDSPVTAADREAELVLREQLGKAFPGHAIWGEEYGRDDAVDSDYLWLLDPIDGTKSWLAGLPFWSIQIALRQHQQLLLGVSHAPALNELAWAAVDQGAWLNDQSIHTSTVTELRDCRLSSGNLATLAKDPVAWPAYGRLLSQCNRIRGYGDYYHYHRLAAGQLDAVLESDVNILDIAALSVLVQEAGGIFTDLDGQPINLRTRSVLAAANAELHQKILTELKNT